MKLRCAGFALVLGFLVVSGCTWLRPRPAPTPTVPDTRAQVAVARQYLALVSNQRYVDAWQLLTPAQQARQTPEQFAAVWRSRGQIRSDAPYGPAQVWPAAVDEVRADVYLDRPPHGGGHERIQLHLERIGADLRVADEQDVTASHLAVASALRAASAADLARAYVVEQYGPLWLSWFDVLDDETIEDGEAVVFHVLDPLLPSPGQEPQPAAILVFGRPTADGAWEQAGGGAVAQQVGPTIWQTQVILPRPGTWNGQHRYEVLGPDGAVLSMGSGPFALQAMRAPQAAPIVVTRDSEALPSGCRPGEVADLVVRFLDAFNRGDQAQLAGFFGPQFRWYSVTEGDPSQGGRHFLAYHPDDALTYFAERHQHGERLHLVALDVAASGDISYVVSRQADDFPPGPEDGAWAGIGKGRIDCTGQTIDVWSMGLDSSGEPASVKSLRICPEAPVGTPPDAVVACARAVT